MPPTALLLLLLGLARSAALQIAITGSNSGIGASASKMLLERGHSVIHACRTAEAAAEAVALAGGGAPMVCDLADLQSVRRFAASLSAEAPALDVLCLNAGVSPSRKAEVPARTRDGFEETVGVNHIGHFLLASLLEPVLTRSEGTVVVTASGVHDPDAPGGTVQARAAQSPASSACPDPTPDPPGRPGDRSDAYHDSKLCNVLFAAEAARRWGGGGVAVRAFNPGLITSTGLFRAARRDNFLSAALFSFVATSVARFSQPVEVGGARYAYLATAPEEEVPPGSYLSAPAATSAAATVADGFGPAAVSREAQDKELAARLWERSSAVVGLGVGV
ncbi:hypothetical protein EMIHUDRAFT_76865 [Emiliania huxleyi CCMP1516]|uniref:Protochlorophyllide reductase n=2 Tax=Emiliania huxleyi TaxID=2903 RepID=A0A0D3IJ00_EMIH1|nr:hypothetical protein EMIHUDRAFT_76865 [Emiliania huxleyi CCMP1516]EOD11235.1 hypothetical protein EMIHUDRAFT_76865 [Emiliania huxleyi CCMP1516]|eukprot:XP_005763664.1 hypothetical protein EMIHUDRAFT_76865 [Emiliania huxleyi CCMP1516]